MAKNPRKVADRLIAGIKRFQPILAAAKVRDVGESDTVMIVTDMLAEVFDYDKYSEITSEFSIRGTFVDLATKIDGVPQTLIEVKAIGLELKDAHVKQAVDYAANQGIGFWSTATAVSTAGCSERAKLTWNASWRSRSLRRSIRRMPMRCRMLGQRRQHI
jgi:hypothetical protein